MQGETCSGLGKQGQPAKALSPRWSFGHAGSPMRTEPFFAELIVESFLSGKRIDTFLTKHFRNYSAYRVQRIVRAGEVRINDVLADNDSRVYRDQRVAVRLIEPPDRLLPPTPGPLRHSGAGSCAGRTGLAVGWR